MLENTLRLLQYSSANSVPLKFLKIVDNVIINLMTFITDELIEFYRVYKMSVDDIIVAYIHKYENKSDSTLSENIKSFLVVLNNKTLLATYDVSNMSAARRNASERWEGLMTVTERRFEKMKRVSDFFDSISMTHEDKESLDGSFVQNNVTKSFDVEYTKFDMDEENSKFIFNDTLTNEKLFLVQYVDGEGKFLTKIHDTADRDLIETPRQPNTITYKYKENNEIITVVLYIERKRAEFTYFVLQDASLIDGIVRSILGDFVLSNERTLYTSGSFNLEIKNYYETNFYCFILLITNIINKDASNIIYLRETSNPRSLKKRVKYYFRDFEVFTHPDYALSFTIDNVFGTLYSVNYKAKNRTIEYVKDIAYLIHKFMKFYDEEGVTSNGELIAGAFIQKAYGKTFDYEEKTFARIPNKITKLRSKSKADNMFPGGGEYTKSMCECKLQPIIVDREDVKDWEEYADYNKNGMQVKHNGMLFPPENSSQGPKQYYICPTSTYPIPILKPNTGVNASQYPYLPCCKMTGKDTLSDKYEEIRLSGKGPETKVKQSELETQYLPLSLDNFFKSLVDERLQVVPVDMDTNSSLLACVIEGTKNYTPPIRKDVANGDAIQSVLKRYKSDYKKYTTEFRKNITRFGVNINVLKQELFDYDDDDIIEIIKSDQYLDSMMFFRILEEIFNVNIFVFTTVEDKAVLEKPRYKNFHFRNINEQLPNLFIFRDSSSLKGRYSLISGKESIFWGVKMSNFQQYTYLTKIDKSGKTTRVDPYRNVIWNVILKDHTIISQKINKEGKCYCINTMFGTTPVSLYVPQCAPLNVPSTTRTYQATSKIVETIMGKGVNGSRGLWYNMNGLKCIFVPCVDVPESEDICRQYVIDYNSVREFKEYNLYNIHTKNSLILTELFVWMWRSSSKGLEEWFDTYIELDAFKNIFSNNIINYTDLLPSYTTTENCLKWIRERNPDYKNVFQADRIAIYKELRDNLYLFMKKIDLSSKGLENIQRNYMSNLLLTKADYKVKDDEKLFDDDVAIENWRQDRFHTIEVRDKLEPYDKYIYRDSKGDTYLVINTDKFQKAMLYTIFWSKQSKIPEDKYLTDSPTLLNDVTKKYGYSIYDTSMKLIKQSVKNSNIDIIRFKNGSFSTYIRMI